MQTIAICSQKGGSGKTTLAVHLATEAWLCGVPSFVLDTDPQRSALTWWQVRRTLAQRIEPVVAYVPADQIRSGLESARLAKTKLAICDTAPHQAASVAGVVREADLVLIPCRPTPLDLAALPATIRMLQGRPAAVVLSACPSRAPEIAEAHQVVAAHGLSVIATVHERRAMFRALSRGLAVRELDRDPASAPAATEIASLFSAVRAVGQSPSRSLACQS